MNATTTVLRAVQRFHQVRRGPHEHHHQVRARQLARMMSEPDPRMAEADKAKSALTATGLAISSQAEPGPLKVELRGELLAVPDLILSAIATAAEVRLHLCSGGGCADAAKAVLLALQKAGKVVVTAGVYNASAAALLLACAPGQRRMAAGGQLIFHAPAGCVFGPAKLLALAAKKLHRDETFWRQELRLRTKAPAADIRAWLESGNDYLATAEQALALGLVDELVNEPL